MIRGLQFIILFLTVLTAFDSQAQNRFYHVYVDTDNNTATGCDVNLPAFSTAINGAEGRISITTDSSQPPAITSTLYHNCSGLVFDAGTAINPAALGLNAGLNGEDVFEVGLNRATMNAGASRAVVIYYATESNTASDIVLSNVDGNPIILGMTLPVPAIGLMAIVILLVLFLIIANRHLNQKITLMVVLMVIATSAWAVVIVVDGQTADWSTVNPANTDPVNDTSSPGSYADLTNVFFTSHNDDVYFRMDVVDVENQAPVANNSSGSTLEDNAVTLTVSGSDAESDPLTFAVNSPPSNGTLSAFTVINSTTSTVVYTPNADFNGNDSFTFVANDGQVNSAPASANVTITAVNDAPTFTSGGNVTHLETGGPYSQIWATNISEGATNETGQTLSFTILSNDNSALFSSQPTIDSSGTLSFEAVTDVSGSANLTLNLSDDGGTANGGADTSATMNLTITITDVNDPPSFSAGPDQSNNEDAGATTVNGWATAISAGPPDEAGQTLTFNITANDNPALFSDGPTVAANGDLSYTPATDANGVANITLELMDDGGTANGGNDTSPPQSFMITLNAVNDPPVFTLGADQNILEDSGAQTVNGWATDIAPGPADEASQTVSFTVTNNNNALFIVQPALDASGNLAYTPAPDISGSAVVTVTGMDDGGTANGGQDTSAPQNFTINIANINDAPSFTAASNPPATNEDSGAESLPWASAISAGPADESGQTLSFMLTQTSIDATLAFSAGPTVNSATGNVEFTAAANTFGSAVYDVVLMDNGGTANGGVDTSSPPVSLTITVNPVNDAPIVIPPGPFPATAHIRIAIPDGSNDLLAGATDVESSTTLTVQGSGTLTTANNGVVTVNNSTGEFSYDPPPGFTGSDSFQYQVCDDGIPLPSACSAPATVNLNVSGNVVWFIDNSAAAGGDGTLLSPFDSLADFNGSATPADGDYIYLAGGTYNEAGIILTDNQVLFGQGTTGSFDTIAGISPSPESVARPSLNGTNPTLISSSDGISLALNNTVRGIDVDDTIGHGLQGSAVGNLFVSEVSVTGNGGALEITTSGNFGNNVTFVELSSNVNGEIGINLNNVNGSLTVTNPGAGLTNGFTQPALRINGGNLTVNYPGSINNTAGHAVNIQNKSAGTVTLSGNITDSALGISLVNNSGSSINITGNLALSTGTNPAFVADNSGTISVTGINNTISTTSGRAIEIQNTTIAPSHVNFVNINQSGGTNAILLNNTGSSGGFRINGIGTTVGSGGTLSNISQEAILLTDTQNVLLNGLAVNNITREAVKGIRVNGLTISNSSFTAVGSADPQDVFGFVRTGQSDNGLQGTALFQNLSLSSFLERGIDIVNEGTGSLDLDIDNVNFDDNHDTFGEDAIRVQSRGGINTNVLLTNSAFNNVESDILAYFAEGTGSNTVEVTNAVSTNGGGPDNFPNGGGIAVIASNSATVLFDINGNDMTEVFGEMALVVGLPGPAGSVNMSGVIENNGSITFPNSSFNSDAIDLDFDGNLTGNTSVGGNIVINNNFMNFEDDAVGLDHRDASGTINLTVSNNTFAGIAGDDGVTTDIDDGVFIFTDNDVAASVNQLNVEIASNTINNISGSKNLVEVVDVQNANKVCLDLIGTQGTAGEIELDTVNSADLGIVQTSAANLSSANNGFLVDNQAPGATFGVAVCIP